MVAAVIDGTAALLPLLWLATLLARRRRGAPLGGYVRATLWAVVISYVLAHVNRWFDLWPAHPYFPSGHETFAACIGTAVASENRRFALLAVALLALLGYLLVRAGWHDTMEVAAGFALGMLVMATAQFVRARTGNPRR